MCFSRQITHYNTVVIGAGPSGLVSAKLLQDQHIDYIVLEESDRVAKSWHAVWENFRLGQTISQIIMPGLSLDAFDPDHRLTRNGNRSRLCHASMLLAGIQCP